MADLPIQLKFFKKLELYQEIKRQDGKAGQSDHLDGIWDKEKKILMWAGVGHHKLARGLTHNEIYERVYDKEYQEKYYEAFTSYNIKPNSKDEEYDIIIPRLVNNVGQIGDAVENLVIKGYAEHPEIGNRSIRFTLDGLLMGEVLDEYQNTWRGKIKFPIFIILTWATIISGIIITIFNAVKIFSF